MPYSIERYNGTTLTVVEDGTVDDTLDIKLIGKNYAGYGEVQNENFLFLLENFSGTRPPSKPISGQVWYDASTKKLKFYDDLKWKSTGGAEISDNAPTGLGIGDFWFDTLNNKLYAWSGTEYILIGPQNVTGKGTTQMRSRLVKDNTGTTHAIIEALVNSEVIYIISSTTFTLDNIANPINGFAYIRKGLTLRDTDVDGVTTSDHRYWGTASNADKLGGYPASDYLRGGISSFSELVRFSDYGFTVGNDNDLEVFINDGDKPIIRNGVGNTIEFQTKVGTNNKTPLKLVDNTLVPGETNTTNIGSTTLKYATIYATKLEGISAKADTILVSDSSLTDKYLSARTDSIASTVAVRDSTNTIKADKFDGTAVKALFADLAEKYLPDAEYDIGTVVKIGGINEITKTKSGDRAIGAISENPAFMMNKELEGGVYVALKGRVPVKVIGKVTKGDRLVASDDGCAISLSLLFLPSTNNVFAIAIESSDDDGIKLIEAVVL